MPASDHAGDSPPRRSRIAERIAEALDYVGVLAVEMFVVGDGGADRACSSTRSRRASTIPATGRSDAASPRSSSSTSARSPAGRSATPTRHADVVMTNLIGDDVDALAGARSPSPAPGCISTARPRPGPAARWATSTGCSRPRTALSRRSVLTAHRPLLVKERANSGRLAADPRPRGCPVQSTTDHDRTFRLQVLVRDNNVDQALKALKKKMQREGLFREMKLRNYYEKPSERRAREKAEAVRRARKLARKRAQREGLIAAPKPRPRRAEPPSIRRLSALG